MKVRELQASYRQCRRILIKSSEQCNAAFDSFPDGRDTDVAKVFSRSGMEHVRKYCERLSPGTHVLQRRCYLQLWAYAHKIGATPEACDRDLWIPPKVIYRAPRAFTRSEVSKIISHIDQMACWGNRARAGMRSFVVAAYFTGARSRHIMDAPRDAIDVESCSLRIVDTKVGRERVFHLPPEAAKIIADGRATSQIHPRWRYLIPVESIVRRFEMICASAGIVRARGMLLHAMRRSCATHIAAVKGIAAAAEHLGHSDTSMTIEHYIDPTQVPVRSHCDALDATLMLPPRAG